MPDVKGEKAAWREEKTGRERDRMGDVKRRGFERMKRAEPQRTAPRYEEFEMLSGAGVMRQKCAGKDVGETRTTSGSAGGQDARNS